MKIIKTSILFTLGASAITQSFAQSTNTLQNFFNNTQNFSDSSSINGTYNLDSISSGLELTITGDATFREANATRDDRFGIWGGGELTFSFNQAIDVKYFTDGVHRPGELQYWTGNGQRTSSFADDSAYNITSNSFENISGEALFENEVFINFENTFGFTFGLSGDADQPIDVVGNLHFGTVPEPSSALFLSLTGLASLTRRKR